MSTIEMKPGVTVDENAARDLESRLEGSVTLPGDQGYDAARAVWNGMIDRYPAIIIHCASTGDVVEAVNFCRENELTVAVRGGGHNVAGHATCDDGAVIDLEPMKKIDVNPVAKVATVGGGVTWGELDAASQVYGLATPGGVFSDTGVAGLTLGGGLGYLRNTHGLSCDNLIGAEVVLADGSVVRADEVENPDLLWGLRGGGGNFGIVTSFEFRLHELGPEVAFSFIFHNAEGDKLAEAIRFYRDYTTSAPDEVGTLFACGVIPPHEEVFPKEIHGKPFALFAGLYAGSVEDGKHALQPLQDFGEPLIDFGGVMPYVEAQKMFDEDYPDGLRYYWKSINVSRLDDEVIERIVKHSRKQVSPFSTIDIWHVGGAVSRKGPEDGAFFGRNAAFLISPEANWEEPEDDEANIKWLRELIADMKEFSDGSRYLNFAGFQEEGDAMMRDAFGPYYQRLAELKKKYDPTNFFALNQNIKPAE